MTPDLVTEEFVIGGVMICHATGEPVPPEVALIEPEFFGSADHAMIWMAIQEVVSKGAPADVVAVMRQVCEWKRDDLWKLVSRLDEEGAFPCNLRHWLKPLLEDGQKRMLRQRVAEAVDRAASGESFDSIASGVQDAIKSVERASVTAGIQHVGKALIRTIEEVFNRAANPDGSRLVKTGLKDLDEAVELRAGQLTIIAGRPSMGKSALAGNIAAYCAKDSEKGCVALFSLEMSAESLIMRLMSREAKVSERAVSDLILEGRTELAAKIHKLDLHIDDRSGLGIEDMRRGLLSLKKKVRLVVVDYLQLARLDSHLDRHDLRIGAIAKGLKAISKDFGCHVIALSQLNRDVEKRNPPLPHMSDLRDSGNIEEDADNVWLLYRAAYYDKKADEGVADIIVGKQRSGRTGTVQVAWIPHTQTFADLLNEPKDYPESRYAD